jgi:hypothetical protein
MTHTRSVRKPIALDRDNLLRIYDGAGLRLTPASGVLWITEEQSANDTVLLPGDTHRLDRPGLAVVQAHRPARVLIELPAGAAAPRRVDFALALGGPGRRVAFPTRGRTWIDGWVRATAIALRKAYAALARRRKTVGRAGSSLSRKFPFPYY